MMRKILVFLLLLYMMIPISLYARHKSKILVVDIKEAGTSVVENRSHDYRERQKALIYEICKNRDIEPFEHVWDGNTDRLKALLKSGDYDFCVMLGGNSQLIYKPLNDPNGYIKYFWQPDTSYNHTPTLVWFTYDARTYGGYYTSGASSSTRSMRSSPTYFLCSTDSSGYGGALDTFHVYTTSTYLTTYLADWDGTTQITKYLTSLNYPAGGTDDTGFLVFWKYSKDGLDYYYTGIRDGSIALLVDAVICKYVSDYRILQYAISIDDFGMLKQSGYYSYNGLNHANFYSKADSFLQSFIDNDLKLTIGATTRYLAGSCLSTDSTDYSEWKALVDKYKDNPHFAWVWHDHAENCPSDSIGALFHNQACYNDWREKLASKYDTVTVDVMDSLYQVWQDSMIAWGIYPRAVIFPPADVYKGHYGNLKDSVLSLCAREGAILRTKFAEATNHKDYWDTEKINGVKCINEFYYTPDTTTFSISATAPNIAEEIWKSAWGYWFYMSYDISGLNQGKTGLFINSNFALKGNFYTGRHTPIVVLHFYGLIDNVGRGHLQKLRRYIEYIREYQDFLEWIAGKPLYQSVFVDELDWEQIR